MRHELLVVAVLRRDDGRHKVDKLLRVRAAGEEEIHAVGRRSDVHGLRVCAVLQDELLKEQEGALVSNLLTNLQGGGGEREGEEDERLLLDHEHLQIPQTVNPSESGPH